MNQNTIRIINEGAKELEATVIAMFQLNDTNDKYAIYTFNEEDAQGLVKIYASRMVEVSGLYSFVSISNTEEWSSIKDVMKYMAKTDDEDGTNGGKIKLIPVGEIKKQMKEPISVNIAETKAAKIGPNYKSGIVNCYTKNAKSNVEDKPSVAAKPASTDLEMPKKEEKPVELNIPDMSIPSFEIPRQNSAKIEMPEVESTEPVVTPVEVDESKNEEETPEPPKFEMPKFESESDKTEEKDEPKVEIPKFEMPKVDETEEENSFVTPKFDKDENENSFEPPKFEDEDDNIENDEIPSVDSVLNKVSYYQNVKEEPIQRDENIIQNIGLEFMKKVSELAEFEKELNRKNRDLEAKERILTKLEKDISSKEERQKNLNQSNKKKEIELKRFEKELNDKESDLNRRIIEFNKKISMFQQTFETMSKN